MRAAAGIALLVPQLALANPYPATEVSGAGYRAGGAAKCGQCAQEGAVNVNLLARVCEYSIPNTVSSTGAAASFVLRTWVNGTTGECDSSPLGPQVRVRPGDRLTVLVRNNITQDGWFADGPLGPPEVTPADYLSLVSPQGRYAGMGNCSVGPLRPHGKQARTVDEFAVNWDNIPRNFDHTNLHLHGVTVAPHLFHPQGTSNPAADYINIAPPSDPMHEEQGCYCYVFDIPPFHPTGTFWYHIHRHHSVAVQAWSGMAGMLVIEGGAQDKELAQYGVTREEPFVIWDPHVEEREVGTTARHAVHGVTKKSVDKFLKDQTDTSEVVYLVNAAKSPHFTLYAGEVIRIRILCATTENLATFKLYDSAGIPVTFYHIASDGIAFDRTYPKDLIVMSGGQREDILIQFPSPGTYTAVSEGLEFVQFFCTGPSNATLAFFDVNPPPPIAPTLVPSQWVFTPGVAPLTSEQVGARRTVTMNVFANRGVAPFPQFAVNGNAYKPDRITEWLREGDIEEWVLINPGNTWHPFHVHVSPFMLVSVHSAWPYAEPFRDVTGTLRPPYGLDIHNYATHQVPSGRWRDTTFLPPFSVVTVWTRYIPGYRGKTLFHCHFLAHEDTGMVANTMLLFANTTCPIHNAFNQTTDPGPGSSCYGVPLR